MQRYHRQRHRLVWMLFLPLAILILIIAVMNRPQWTKMEVLPGTVGRTPSLSK